MDLIRPAVEGTKAVLAAAKAAGVRRVCLTSSIAAITSVPRELRSEVFTEANWSDVNCHEITAYEKSKTLAERAAWEFVENLPDDDKIELSVVNPGLVMGPPLVKTDFASGKIMKLFMENNLPGGVPLMQFPMVDVRDVA